MLRVKVNDPLLAGLYTQRERAAMIAKSRAVKAKRVRTEPSAEDVLDAQLQSEGITCYERQYKFATSIGRKWASDFGFYSDRVLVEVEGGLYRRGGGAHSTGPAIERDMEKLNDATLLKWRMLRFTTEEALNGTALAFIKLVIGWA